MRTILIAGALALVGCQPTAARHHGETLRAYGGGIAVVFTNATPDTMCGLYMSFDDEHDYGDNWLARPVPSGASMQFQIRPGTYKARWETCAKHGPTPTFAATLWREMAFAVDHETQLYAYVADSVAPTTRAAVLGRDHAKVMFQGQAVPAIGSTPPVVIAAIPNHTKVASSEEAPPVPVKRERFNDYIDGKAKATFGKTMNRKTKGKGTKAKLRPSARRLAGPADVAYGR